MYDPEANYMRAMADIRMKIPFIFAKKKLLLISIRG
ncbi:MAG: hypothetical protein K0S76_1122 [Herbinix sp.]|jgi:hypothetical protein|nr:hypothetical protein [Herbinix sp.]